MAITIGRGALATVDLIIAQGADNAYSFRYSREVDGVRTPVDLTGYVARGQIRRRVGEEVYLDLAGILLTADGAIQITIPAGETEAPEWNKRREGVWDLELVSPDGGVVRFAAGAVSIVPDVTRAK